MISDQLSTPILAAMMAVSPLKFLLNSGFDDIEVEKVNVEITVEERIQQTILEKVWHDRVEVDPGKEINLTSKLVNFGDTTQCVYYSTFGSMSTQCKPLCTKAAEKVRKKLETVRCAKIENIS